MQAFKNGNSPCEPTGEGAWLFTFLNSCNPVIIDLRKARFTSKPKPLMSLPSSAQERYRKLYSHIATEIEQGTEQQSVASEVFSFLGENCVSYSWFIANSDG